MATADPVTDLLSRLQGVKPAGEGKWKALCPGHPDRNQSLSIARGDKGVVLHCHAKCATEAICAAMGITQADLFIREDHRGNGPSRRIVATYGYCDENAELLYEAVRYLPKDFRQRRPDGKNGWVWNMQGVRRVLYRLPELLNSDEDRPDDWVFICEGEKDVDALRGVDLIATCNVGGAGKWKDEYSETLRGRRVCIIADKDEPGLKHAQEAAASLSGKAADVRIVECPGDGVKDASDFLSAGGTASQLIALADAAQVWTPENKFDPGTRKGTVISTAVQQQAIAPVVVNLAGGDESLAARAQLLTDVGNAAEFVRQYGTNIRFCHPWGKWLIFDRTHWAIDDRGAIAKLAMQAVLSRYKQAADESDIDRRNALLEHAKKSQRKERIAAMIELAKPYVAIVPSELDADPLLLNAKNGTIDLRIGELRAHRREDYLTKICRASYRADADCPIFKAFLDRIFRSKPDLIPYSQKALGYGCTGLTGEQVLFFLFGIGSNGKTTLMDAVMYGLGDYAAKADRDLLTAQDGQVHPTNVADIMGRRMVLVSETEDGKRFDESKLKDLVGETRLKARFMRCDFFEFIATHKIFMYGNHKPVVRGTDFGFWRRMRLIPFVEVIGEDEKDRNLPEKLKAEADGILAWLVRGCIAWQREGLGLPDEVAQATDGYRREMDSIGAFLMECCLLGERLEASAKDLYAAYSGWCEDAGERPLSQKRLGMQLTERGLISGRDSFYGRKIWRGIGLKTTENASEVGESFGNYK